MYQHIICYNIYTPLYIQTMSDIIESKSKKPIHKYTIGIDTLFQRSCMLYGPTASGKSTVIKHCLDVLKEKVPLVILVSPTEQINPSFNGFIPDQCIIPKMIMENPSGKKEKEIDKVGRYLEELLKRQEAATMAYKRANKMQILEQLLQRCSSKTINEYEKTIELLQHKKNSVIHRIKKLKLDDIVKLSYIEAAEEKTSNIILEIIKNYLRKENDRLQRLLSEGKLSEEEVTCLKFKNANPNLVLIMDDCADDFKEYCKLKEFKSLFYKGRHYSITLIISCQDDTNLAPDLRKNAFISIFTKAPVAMANFEKKSNGYIKDIALKAIDVIPKIFEEKYRFLVYDRTTEDFYYFKTPSVKKFRFGTKSLWDLCDELKSDEKSYIASNPYYMRLLKG